MTSPSDATFLKVEAKMPVIGQAVGDALDLVSQEPGRFSFFCFVVDGTTGVTCFTTNSARAVMAAALAKFFSDPTTH